MYKKKYLKYKQKYLSLKGGSQQPPNLQCSSIVQSWLDNVVINRDAPTKDEINWLANNKNIKVDDIKNCLKFFGITLPPPDLPIPLIHNNIFSYTSPNFKKIIHKEGSTDEDRSQVQSIEDIMISGMEDHFRDLLLSDKFKNILCDIACKKGYLSTLKWAHENGCPWNAETCRSAAEGGHLNCLEYAHDNECPWNELTCSSAAANGHLNCLQYAYMNGCPWNKQECLSYAISKNNIEMIEWINSL